MGNNNTSGFDKLMWVDDQIIRSYNWIQDLKFSFSRARRKYNLDKNIELKNKHQGKRCFIVGNGPSIKQQDLTLLKGEWTFFVNHFYNHPQVAEISPKYYVIVDPKLITGEWPVTMLDEIIERCPEVNFLLAAQYQDQPEISAYAGHANIHWVYAKQFFHKGFSCSTDLTSCIGISNVVTVCVLASIYMGFEDIYLLGVDCDGIFRDLVDQSSHFYEAKKENIGDNDPDLIVTSLRSSIQGIRGWSVISKKFENSSHRIINLTRGGLLNAFPRQEYKTVVSSKHPQYLS